MNYQNGSPQGFAYSVNNEELERYRHLEPEDKLRWLKKANSTRRHLPSNIQDLHAKFRQALMDGDGPGENVTEFEIL